MALTLCPNCRLPVNASSQRCSQCGVGLRSVVATRHVPVAAAIALAATLAMLARRYAA